MESVFTPTPSRLTTSITKRKFFLLRWWEEENLSFLANWVVSKKKNKRRENALPRHFFCVRGQFFPVFISPPPPLSRSLYGTKEQSEANSQMTTKRGAQEKKIYRGKERAFGVQNSFESYWRGELPLMRLPTPNSQGRDSVILNSKK